MGRFFARRLLQFVPVLLGTMFLLHYLQSLSVQINGDPIRADVKMTLKQAAPASTASANGANRSGNPTTRANAGHGVHTVKDGDSLPSIAYQAYGDATVWRAIAEANDIENPLHIRRGRSLSLPKLDA